ncbi:ogr/Delta-like zinc finger family protein [Vibrio lentus]|uniref:ogr/Delta-like zinc finger family protein n=1 Tax=Vibrio TaxID=662 RepID=UPI0009B6D3A1|nr:MULTISPECIES: ogr/Delta-like zinc finger family protein [Vibrio]
MLITCPVCECKSRIATSKAITNETREAYCQCLNLNCGTVFVTLTSVSKIVKTNGSKPNLELQPELCKVGDLNQVDMFS